ncbi:hypothetical protein F970_02449 [Acinetobacter sp. CIP 102082]|uniref:Acetyltransferase n=1 Tax=Acinetobacter parvus DSM 16617 = CIP 108168 TaxID=981333 RepID=N8QFM0_9GAMM|nr:hypothetical protein [Acinetobacter parvus]ENU37551.1 hypothetical protein F988_00213 [Acinetobacter parvus DSM 16617 = CIP 108168]ENU84133.1 hypothetical protein F974_00636 [Acinetobacter sp. CIP 102159]ENU90520.1 hypothetical protein F972_00255 [Acinetobacter sp. CIP 102529]ENU94978.1 hypothetical protein F970_02449 [Acinetobacter sp. CIP 102082]ENX66568.1 hypothetical protein F884_00947 [Acinetobacter sp. CIP 102143]
MVLDAVHPENYAELLAVWEDSVRATHDFISEDDIAFFKPIIMEQLCTRQISQNPYPIRILLS